MKKWTFLMVGLLFCLPAQAASLTAQGGWLHTPNSNYGDSGGAVARLEQPIWGDLSAGAEFGYHGAQSHGSYGSIEGYHALAEAIYNVPVKWAFKPYLLGGWGWSWWNWDRSQDMIDRGIEIKLGNAFAQKYGVGGNYEIGNGWSINVEWNYFMADVPKDAFYEATGLPSNVGGNDDRSGRVRIGQAETALMFGIKKRF